MQNLSEHEDQSIQYKGSLLYMGFFYMGLRHYSSLLSNIEFLLAEDIFGGHYSSLLSNIEFLLAEDIFGGSTRIAACG